MARRQRPTFACEPCRRKKIRCDRNIPCNQCTRSKSEYCAYLQTQHSGLSPPCFSRPGGTSVKRKRASSAYRERGRTPGYSDLTARPTSATSPVPESAFSIQSEDEDSNDEGESYDTAESENTDSGLPVRGVFRKSLFFGPSHWMNSIVHFRRVCTLQLRLEESPESTLQTQCDCLIQSIASQQSVLAGLTCGIRQLIPPEEITNQLVQAYLRTFESTLRILHVPSFLSECQSFWRRPERASNEFILQLLLVISIGHRFCPNLDETYNASTWTHAAETELRSCGEQKNVSIVGVQNICLLLLARLMNPQPATSSLIGAPVEILLRVAMQIGLHINPRQLPEMSFFEQEIRRRLWATVLELSLQFSIEIGAMPPLSIPDTKPELPMNIPDEQFDPQTKVPPKPNPSGQFSHTSMQICLMESFPVRYQIAALVNNPRRAVSYKEALQLSSELSVYCRSNPAKLAGDKKTQSHRCPARMLDLFIYRFLLALHVPFALRASTDPTFYFSRKVAVEIVATLLDRSSSTDSDDYSRAMLMGSGVFSSASILAASVLCAELLSGLEEDMSSFTPSPALSTWQHLRKVLSNTIDLLFQRIAQSTPDVEVFVLFSGLAKQIDALQAGKTAGCVDAAISEGMHKALVDSVEVLRARAGDGQMLDPVLGLDDTPSTSSLPSLNDIAWDQLNFKDWMPCDEFGVMGEIV